MAQVQQGINYQAVAFNGSGLPIMNTTLQVKAGILSDTLAPVIVWEELHSSVKTNYSGVFNLVVGTGTKQGGSAATFNNIDWSVSPLYLKIQIYYQNSWKYMGTSRLWSVPRAMVAGDLEGPVKKLAVKGETDINDEPLFEVKNRTGQTVFAVYNEGVRIYVDDGAKGTKGGFAVGGFGTDKAPSQNLLFISNDSIRAYIDATPGKGTKGGFAVGGFDVTKASTQDMLVVSGDSIRAYIDDSAGKGTKGGFAVGGFDASKGLADNYMHIDADSTRFYLHELAKGGSSTFNIVGINADQTQTILMTANKDTVDIGAVLNVQNNLNVTGNIGYTGDVKLVVPTVYMMEPGNVFETSVMIESEVMDDGGSPVLARGVVWSTLPDPTVALPTKTVDGTALGILSSNITGLTPGTTYYVKAYATNANGTGYSNEITITTPLAGSTVTDIDGNLYNTVLIGTQTWMVQNLKTTRYNDGVPIPCVKADASWMALATGGYTWYNNDSLTYADYGMLYNWPTVNTGILCPTGWHVPTDTEWLTLSAFLGGTNVAGGKLKEVDTAHWLSPNIGATNETGFTALPGGLRGYMGPFMDIGTSANFWTSSMISVDPANVILNTNNAQMTIGQIMSGMGHSVRCIKS
ncbi:MAG: hypothetical protein MUF36_01055 [Bacteroidales bacterium]|nr:hypothetical protein [Bacteroidales bacterium]